MSQSQTPIRDTKRRRQKDKNKQVQSNQTKFKRKRTKEKNKQVQSNQTKLKRKRTKEKTNKCKAKKKKKKKKRKKERNARAAHIPLTRSLFLKRGVKLSKINKQSKQYIDTCEIIYTFVRSLFCSFIRSFIRQSVDSTLGMFRTVSCKKRKKSNSYGG